jgi:hypothetical protein
VVVPLAGLVDLDKERDKLGKELEQLDKQLGALRGRLGNAGFTSRAPAAVVEAERDKERSWAERREPARGEDRGPRRRVTAGALGGTSGGRRVAALGAAALAVAAACASPGQPPGGPERRTPPRLLRVSPESGATNVRAREVVFEYDAVVSETPRGGAASASAGTTGLEALVTVSPRSGSVAVDWRRERIAIRPRRGFRPDLTYTVTVLPGIQDLRSNVRDTASVTVFSTGGPLARAALRGVVFDWVNNRPASRAVVEATGADSVTYYAVADSVGRFVVPNVPAAAYLVRGTVDVNLNHTADPREPFDTARATAAAAPPAPGAGEGLALYAFIRDTLGPVLTVVAATDSTTLRLTFDRPLRPEQALAGRVRVVGADSVALPVRSVLTAAQFDSAQRAAPGDSAAGASPPGSAGLPGSAPGAAPLPARPLGTAAAAQPPRPTRPVPPTELVVRLGAALRPNAAVRVRVSDVRTLSNVAGTTERTFTTPRAAPAARPAAAVPAPPAAVPPAGAPAGPPAVAPGVPPGTRPNAPAAPAATPPPPSPVRRP